ncbi:NACHT domain-containing protein [Fusarium bulbicola]|nr:NACHT domain-containing protein [Fusarium bulbicola]
MAQRLLEISCNRFKAGISDDDDRLIRATSTDDVQVAIKQIETQLAARGSLRNLGRLTPYLNAIERYSKAVDPLCNGVPYLSYIWAPVKFILVAVHEHTKILDKMLSAYAQIGNSLPWLSRLGESFPEDRGFQQLFAFLYDDIIEFHRKAYALIRKPAWKIFFCSAWGRFEHRFGDLIESISKVSALIDKEAASLDIQHAQEWRQKALEHSATREQRWEAEQSQALMKWLEAGDNDQDLKLEWLKERCCPGTGSWIVQNDKFRSWLQKARGSPIMWLYGKPGSGKSVLVSQIISFLRLKKSTQVLFFFCDYHSTPYAITARIFRAFTAQIVETAPEIIPFLYDEYLAKGKRPSASVLKSALVEILAEFDDVRLVVDGIDELPADEHKNLINELKQLKKASSNSCKLLMSSQDLPTIRPFASQKLSPKSLLSLGHEKMAIEKDVQIIVINSLESLHEKVGMTIRPCIMEELQSSILQKAEDYVDRDMHRSELTIRTGLGVFSLQRYANEHWVEHLLQVFEDSASVSNIDQCSVVRQVLRLYEKHSHLIKSRSTSPSAHLQEKSKTELDSRLGSMDFMPKLQHFIQQVINFRKTMESEQAKNGLDVNVLDLDMTLFSRVDDYYRRDVQFLCQIDSYQGLSQEELLAFHSNYGANAFTCLIRACGRFRSGYDSATQLEDHKRAHHDIRMETLFPVQKIDFTDDKLYSPSKYLPNLGDPPEQQPQQTEVSPKPVTMVHQAYPRYLSTPRPITPGDPRERTGRSYKPLDYPPSTVLLASPAQLESNPKPEMIDRSWLRQADFDNDGSRYENYGYETPLASTLFQTPPAVPFHQPKSRKGGLNIMSLLNGDPAPPKE